VQKFGLIGYPLSHSFSKLYFEKKFQALGLSDSAYFNFPLADIGQFSGLLQKERELVGLSVTIPYKESIIPYLDELHDIAKEIGAVNCIKIKNGKYKGYNTDAYGFRQSLRPFLDTNHTKALILGTGGASRAVAYVLKNLSIDYWFVSRAKKPGQLNSLCYDEINEHVVRSCKLIINCTPLGMMPDTEVFPPLPYNAITQEHLVYDLIYNPAETLFLKKAREQGALISNGYNMLCFQADEAWKIWNSDAI
jgi:shikimate dehydrogenase